MNKFFRTFIIISLIGLISSKISAQTVASTQVPIRASLIKGLTLKHINGDLDFGEIVLNNVSGKISKETSNGIVLEINGFPNRNVVVNYNNSTLTNNLWSIQFGGSNSTIDFVPKVELTSSLTYNGAFPVLSGNTYTLNNSSGIGILYLWVGGELQISESQPAGDYEGQFVVTLSY